MVSGSRSSGPSPEVMAARPRSPTARVAARSSPCASRRVTVHMLPTPSFRAREPTLGPAIPIADLLRDSSGGHHETSPRLAAAVSAIAIVIAGFGVLSGAATRRSVGATGSTPAWSVAVHDDHRQPVVPTCPGDDVGRRRDHRRQADVHRGHGDDRTRRIAGVDTVAVEDQGFTSGRLEENTTDYFAQDARGTVWYFGEDTVMLYVEGKVTSREGTWHAGRGGASPGSSWRRRRGVRRDIRQEYLKGHAEDSYRVETTSTSVTVPFGSFPDALRRPPSGHRSNPRCANGRPTPVASVNSRARRPGVRPRPRASSRSATPDRLISTRCDQGHAAVHNRSRR